MESVQGSAAAHIFAFQKGHYKEALQGLQPGEEKED